MLICNVNAILINFGRLLSGKTGDAGVKRVITEKRVFKFVSCSVTGSSFFICCSIGASLRSMSNSNCYRVILPAELSFMFSFPARTAPYGAMVLLNAFLV